MKNKILIFIFTILTFGLFAIPLTFASSYSTLDLSKVNRVSNITWHDNSKYFDLFVEYNDINENGKYWYLSIAFYDDNYNLINTYGKFSNCEIYYNIGNSSTETKSYLEYANVNGVYSYYSIPNNNSGFTTTSSIRNLHFLFMFNTQTDYNTFKNNTNHFMCCNIYRSTSTSGIIPYSTNFVGNDFYSSFAYSGIFENSEVYLKLQGSSGMGSNISSDVLGYNTISFNETLINNISANNDVNGYQYYIRVYFNNYIKNLSNLNISYLEFSNMRMNGITYNSYTSSRNALPILYNNIVLYNNSATLFTTDDLLNSGYGNYYLEYIEFNLANYSFKSSSYYNANMGIRGYIANTRITGLNFNNLEVYDNGFKEGYINGYENGKNDGYNEGVSSNRTSFDNLMLSVANVPMTIISSMLSFDILGVNLLGFFMGIITLLLFVKLMRKFKE